MVKGTFIHLPKCAGTNFQQGTQFNYWAHRPAGVLLQRFPHTDWFFTIMRDPVERFVSAFNYAGALESYHHKVGTETEHQDFSVVSRSRGPNSFIIKFFLSVIKEILFGQERLTRSVHFRRQVSFLKGRGNIPIYIIDMDRLNSVYPDLMMILGVDAAPEIGYMNKSVKGKKKLSILSRILLRLLFWPDFILYRRVRKSEQGWIQI